MVKAIAAALDQILRGTPRRDRKWYDWVIRFTSVNVPTWHVLRVGRFDRKPIASGSQLHGEIKRNAIMERTAAGVSGQRAVEWLRTLGESLKGTENADLLHATYERITVAGPRIVSVRLTQAACAHGLALALPEKVAMARPTGVGHAFATYDIPIEGRDEWVAAARRLA